MYIEVKDLLKKFNLHPENLLQREVIIKSTRGIQIDAKVHANQSAIVVALDKYPEGQLKLQSAHFSKPFYIPLEDVGFIPMTLEENDYLVEMTEQRLSSLKKLSEYLKSLPKEKAFTWDDYVFHNIMTEIKEGRVDNAEAFTELLTNLGIK